MTTLEPPVDDLLRTLAPQVVGVLTRRYGDFAAAEDAVQDAWWTRPGSGRPRACRAVRAAG